ncbi:MAG: hypothetical protein QNJ92_12280 [Alphaproteobacteria bacterium]|nr:hypothetical protein [Alphaproteobacteria bacterium]
MKQLGLWFAAIGVGVIGVIGLFLAAGAHDGTMYYVGLLIFLFACVFEFSLIARQTDYHRKKDPALD